MKLLKILSLCILFFILIFSNVYATGSEENFSNDLQILSSLLTTDTNETENTALIAEQETTSTVPTSSQIVTTSTVSDDGGLSVSDIINIILIAVGLVLIFLAVAILLRSK